MALAAASLDTLFEDQIGTGKALFRIHHANAFIFADAASIEEIAWRHRVDGLVASTLLNLGYALHYVPTLEGEVRDGSIPLVSAAQLGRLVREGALEPLEEWLELARTYSERDLRAAVRRRLAEVRQGREDLRERTFHLTQELNRKFDWAKELASKKEGSALTDEKALDRVTTHYLDTFDPSWPEKVAVKVPGEDLPAVPAHPTAGRRRLGGTPPLADGTMRLAALTVAAAGVLRPRDPGTLAGTVRDPDEHAEPVRPRGRAAGAPAAVRRPAARYRDAGTGSTW